MHEAEGWLVRETALCFEYAKKLHEVICADFDEPINFDPSTMLCMIRATASQRAEAFLRTLGLWREDE